MAQRPTLLQSLQVLQTAWQQNTLRSQSCHKCATAHLIAHANGYIIPHDASGWRRPDQKHVEANWGLYVILPPDSDVFSEADRQLYEQGKAQAEATGYTWQELAGIERVFEKACHEARWARQLTLAHPEGRSGRDMLLRGLKAVIAELYRIHKEEVDQELSAYIDRFMKKEVSHVS